MRLIDADALIEEALTEGAYGYVDALQIAIEPTVDAVEVVRCKNCKHQSEGLIGLICVEGPCVDCIVPEDFYCAYGEPKECDNND